MGIWQRISRFHFPAWMPVATIMVVVLMILGGSSSCSQPRAHPASVATGTRHTRSFIGDELQPRVQEVVTQQGVRTHGDGVIHIHPHQPVAEGGGAALEHFFGDQGGKLSNSERRIPGPRDVQERG